MAQSAGIRSANEHVRHGLTNLVEFFQLKAAAQASRVRKTGVQAAAMLGFGLAILVWLELTVYLALRIPLQPVLAALVTVLVNALALGILNMFLSRWKRENDAALEASLKREEIAYEFRETGAELLALKNGVIESTHEFVHNRVVVPFARYKLPVAVGVTFVTGIVVARALFPAEASPNYNGDVYAKASKD